MDARLRAVGGLELPQSPGQFVIPYVACGGIAALMLAFSPSIEWNVVAPALALQVLVGTLVALAPRLGLGGWKFGGYLAILVYLLSVALLRDGGGTTSGFGPLVLLPVVWAALRGKRAEVAVAVLGVALVYVAPALIIGPPHYPAGSWRGGVLFAAIATTTGVTVLQLVRRVTNLLAQLSRLAGTDELTGLPNRRSWQERLGRALDTASLTDKPVSVALLDIDFFKQYNDAHGHMAGDRLLLATTAAWHGVLRDVDLLARWGGDEFGLLLPGCDARQALAVLTRLRLATPELEFSAGIAQWQPGSSPQALLSAADEALYEAKGRDRNSSAIASVAG